MVLSGDDALALPTIALGGRGVISVASNEIPAEMTQLVQLLPATTISRRRARLQRKYLPLMEVNFIESNPDSGEGGDGRDGTARTGLAAAAVRSQGRKTRKQFGACWNLWVCWRAGMLQEQIEALFDHPPANYTEEHFGCFRVSRTR